MSEDPPVRKKGKLSSSLEKFGSTKEIVDDDDDTTITDDEDEGLLYDHFDDGQIVSNTIDYVHRFLLNYDPLLNTMGAHLARRLAIEHEEQVSIGKLIFVADLVREANLLHPSLVSDYETWRKYVTENDISDDEEPTKFFDLLRGNDMEDFQRAGSWTIYVLDVFANFHSFQPFDKNQFGQTNDEASERAMFETANKASVPVIIEGAKDDGKDNDESPFYIQNVNNFPEFFFAFLMDWRAQFGEDKKTRLIGVSQPQINYRSSDPNVFKSMYDTLTTCGNEDVTEGRYMSSEMKEGMFYACRGESKDKMGEGGGKDRIISAVAGIDQFEKLATRSDFVAKAPRAFDVYNFIRTWTDHKDMVKGGITVDPPPEITEDYAEGDLIDDNQNIKIVFKDQEFVIRPQSDATDDIVALFGIFFHISKFWLLTRDICNTIVEKMMIRQINQGYPLLGEECAERDCDEKRNKAREEREKTLDVLLQSYLENADQDCTPGIACQPAQYTTHPCDQIGLIWLINLASHKLRHGLSAGRHRMISELMSACGCEFRGKSAFPSFEKKIDGPVANNTLKTNYVFHQLNNTVPMICGMAPEESMSRLLEHMLTKSEKQDVSSQKHTPTLFDAIAKGVYWKTVQALDSFPFLKKTRTETQSYLDPMLFSSIHRVSISVDLLFFNLQGAWSKIDNTIDLNMSAAQRTDLSEYRDNIFCSLTTTLRHVAAYWTLENSEKAIKQHQKLKGDKFKYRTIDLNSKGSGLNDVGHIPNYIRRIYSDDALDGEKIWEGSKTLDAVMHLDELVHTCVFTMMYQMLVKNDIFVTVNPKVREMGFAFLPMHYVGRPVSSTGLSRLRNVAGLYKKNSMMPLNVLGWVAIFTILVLHPTGSDIISYFFESVDDREANLQEIYHEMVFISKTDPPRPLPHGDENVRTTWCF